MSAEVNYLTTEKLEELTQDARKPGGTAAIFIAEFLGPKIKWNNFSTFFELSEFDRTIWKYSAADWERVRQQRIRLPHLKDGQIDHLAALTFELPDSAPPIALYEAFKASAKVAYVNKTLGVDFSNPQFDFFAQPIIETRVGRAAQEIYFGDDLLKVGYRFPYLKLFLSRKQIDSVFEGTEEYRKAMYRQISRRRLLFQTAKTGLLVAGTVSAAEFTKLSMVDLLAATDEITRRDVDPIFDTQRTSVLKAEESYTAIDSAMTSVNNKVVDTSNSQDFSNQQSKIFELETSSTQLGEQLVNEQHALGYAEGNKYGDPETKQLIGRVKTFAGAVATIAGVVSIGRKVNKTVDQFKYKKRYLEV